MSVEFALPELGENVEKGDVIRVLVSPGDVVKADQAVLELETDKATIEVPTNVGGTVSEVRVKPGQKVSVGEIVLVLDESGAKGKAGAADRARQAASPSTGPEASRTPSAPQKAAATETRRASDAPIPGRTEPAPEVRPAGAAASRPAAVVDIAAARQAPAPGRGDAAAARDLTGGGRDATPAGARATEAASAIAAAPSVRRYARELGVNIAEVPGTGPGGRIGQEDVKQFVKASLTSPVAGGGAARARTPLPDFAKWGEVDVRPMSNIRRKTAEHLSIAWQAPHVTQHDHADVTALEEFRKTYGPRTLEAGAKLTVTAIVIKILAAAIAKYPQFAASVDLASESIVYKKYVHIGVAVDTPNGLLVPVIRDVDRKTITEIAVELARLSQKARDRKLSLDEMSGGVFSVTNLGGIGGTSFTPIINQPEVAILGLSRAATAPAWTDGRFVPRQMLPLSLSYDHRVIDGADAARFLRFVAEGLEQPLTMAL
jgi:pyruvate dehydrogenase E2 component (dihydrolipoamide acetyltransferase)